MSVTQSSTVLRSAILLKMIAVVLPIAAVNAIRMSPRIWLQRLSFKASLWNGVVRSMMTHMPPQYLQVIFPSTLEAYETWIGRAGSARGFRKRIQPTDAGKTNILWLEKGEKFQKVILFFHGGGYVLPLSNGHLEWMAYIQECLASQDIHVGIAIVEYALAPTHPYPAQLLQAMDALQTLINAGFAMENIVIGGDSAGGHLTLSLLSHLNHPRTSDGQFEPTVKDDYMIASPELPTILGSGRFQAAFLVSPLCSLDTTQTPYHTRSSVDMLSSTIVRNYGKHHLDGSSAYEEMDSGIGWSMPLDMSREAVAAWWSDLDTVVTNVLITAGQEECFRDHCIEYAEVLRVVERKGTGFKARLVLGQDEAHDAPLFDFSAGRPQSATTTAVEQFVLDTFTH